MAMSDPNDPSAPRVVTPEQQAWLDNPAQPNVSMALRDAYGQPTNIGVAMTHTGNWRADQNGNVEMELHPPGSPQQTMFVPQSHVTPLQTAQAQPAPNPAAGITGAIHSMMSDPTKIDTSKYDGSAPITQSQSNALPWWQQTHTIIPDAAVPPAEADPAYQNRLQGVQLMPGVSMTRQQGPNNNALMPAWLSNYLNQ